MHELYEKQRLIKDKDSQEYISLEDEMFELSEGLEVPIGIEEIKNVR